MVSVVLKSTQPQLPWDWLCMRIQRVPHGELGLEGEKFKDREDKAGVEVIPSSFLTRDRIWAPYIGSEEF